MRLRAALLIVVLVCGVIAVGLMLFGSIPDYWMARNWAWLPLAYAMLAAMIVGCVYARDKGRFPRLMSTGIVCAVMAAVIWTTVFGWELMLPLLAPRFATLYDWKWLQGIGAALMLMAACAAQWGALELIRLDWPMHRRLRVAARWSAAAFAIVFGLAALAQMLDEFSVFLAVAILGHIGLLIIFLRLRRRNNQFRRFANLVALVYAGILAILIWQSNVIAVLLEVHYFRRRFSSIYYGSDLFQGLVRPASMLIALALTGAVPVIGLWETVKRREQRGSMDRSISMSVTCPRCRHTQVIQTGVDTCAACGLIFRMTTEEPRCECGYLLYQRHDDTCPECGRPITRPKPPNVRASC